MNFLEANEHYSGITTQLVKYLDGAFFSGKKAVELSFNEECKRRNLLQVSVEVEGKPYYAAFFIQYGLTDILRRSILFYDKHAFITFDKNTNVFLVSEENKSWLDDLVKNISAPTYDAEAEEKFISSLLGQKDHAIF